jgi:hypothetical protein
MTTSKFIPIGYRPPAPAPPETYLLECGHEGAVRAHTLCHACYMANRDMKTEETERDHGLHIQIVGSPKQVAYARNIRAHKVSALAAKVLAGTATVKDCEKLDEFRTKAVAKWFIDNKMYAINGKKKLKKAATK